MIRRFGWFVHEGMFGQSFLVRFWFAMVVLAPVALLWWWLA